jgi:hypothetical protein
MVGIPGVSEKLSYKISFFYSLQVENSLSTYEPHACVVIYSVIAKSSFRVAEEILNYLWRENITRDKAVIIVGNKADLARSRVIATSGKFKNCNAL